MHYAVSKLVAFATKSIVFLLPSVATVGKSVFLKEKLFSFALRGLVIIFLVGGTQTFYACGSSKGGNKKARTIKKGKPIPCPMKDC